MEQWAGNGAVGGQWSSGRAMEQWAGNRAVGGQWSSGRAIEQWAGNGAVGEQWSSGRAMEQWAGNFISYSTLVAITATSLFVFFFVFFVIALFTDRLRKPASSLYGIHLHCHFGTGKSRLLVSRARLSPRVRESGPRDYTFARICLPEQTSPKNWERIEEINNEVIIPSS